MGKQRPHPDTRSHPEAFQARRQTGHVGKPLISVTPWSTATATRIRARKLPAIIDYLKRSISMPTGQVCEHACVAFDSFC